jgi:hypothetical protein
MDIRTMSNPLNSPLEVGVRTLMILREAHPAHLDVTRLVLLDHGLLHSADLGGPESLHPPLPGRVAELGIKRNAIEQGLQVMLRAGLVQMTTNADGIQFVASDSANSFIDVLDSSYAVSLHDRARWVLNRFADLSEETLRRDMHTILGSWVEEFDGTGRVPSHDGETLT